MGLDNGITLYSKTKIDFDTLPFLQEYIDFECESFKSVDGRVGYNVEVVYWRKCWNIRNKIFKVLGLDENKPEHDLTLKDISKIQEVLCDLLLDPYTWEDDGGCIWDLGEMCGRIGKDIVVLGWLKKHLEEDRFSWATFYDSY